MTWGQNVRDCLSEIPRLNSSLADCDDSEGNLKRNEIICLNSSLADCDHYWEHWELYKCLGLNSSLADCDLSCPATSLVLLGV